MKWPYTLPGTALWLAGLMIITSALGCATTPMDPWQSNWMDPEFVVIELDRPKAGQLCLDYYRAPKWFPAEDFLGCVLNKTAAPERISIQKACTIILTKDLEPEFKAKVLEHEKAHCRGWRHGDPQPEGTL